MSKTSKNKLNFKETEEHFLIKKCDSSLAGFGQNVWKIINVSDLKLVCYINESKNIYFPQPIEFSLIHDLLCFIKEYNLGNVCNKAV